MATARTETKKTGNTVEAKGDVRVVLPDARRGLYAYVGAADYAVEKIRALPSYQYQVVAEIRTQVKDLQSQVRELPQTLRTSLTDLQGKVTGTYSEFANRGEKLVTNIRKDPATTTAVDQAKTAKSQVKAARTSVRKAAVEAAEATDSASDKIG
jgi:hypothetical protein